MGTASQTPMDAEASQQKRHTSMSVLVALSSVASVKDIDYPAGTSGTALISIYTTLTAANFNIVLATENGNNPEFSCEDDKSEAWMREHKQLYSRPLPIEEANEQDFDALFLPSALGAIQDMANNESLGTLVQAFLTRKSNILPCTACVACEEFAALCRADWCNWLWCSWSLWSHGC